MTRRLIDNKHNLNIEAISFFFTKLPAFPFPSLAKMIDPEAMLLLLSHPCYIGMTSQLQNSLNLSIQLSPLSVSMHAHC